MTDHSAGDPADVRRVQIIAVALMLGVWMFAGVAVYLGFQNNGNPNGNPNGQPIVSFLMTGMAVMSIAAAFVVSAAMKPASNNTDQLTACWATKNIVRLAALEGAAFANLVAYIVERQWWSLAVVGGLMFLMLANFPTATGLKHYVEGEQAFH